MQMKQLKGFAQSIYLFVTSLEYDNVFCKFIIPLHIPMKNLLKKYSLTFMH